MNLFLNLLSNKIKSLNQTEAAFQWMTVPFSNVLLTMMPKHSV